MVKGEAFLLPHHLEAAKRLERLVERATLGPRLTMSYDPARLPSARGSGAPGADLSDMAADARHRLNELARTLPLECWGVAFDVCALGKGLGVVETERRWPRRSAKLVLRIALDQVARQMGLSPVAEGRAQGLAEWWLSERLPLVDS